MGNGKLVLSLNGSGNSICVRVYDGEGKHRANFNAPLATYGETFEAIVEALIDPVIEWKGEDTKAAKSDDKAAAKAAALAALGHPDAVAPKVRSKANKAAKAAKVVEAVEQTAPIAATEAPSEAARMALLEAQIEQQGNMMAALMAKLDTLAK